MEAGSGRHAHPDVERQVGQARTPNSSTQAKREIAAKRCGTAHTNRELGSMLRWYWQTAAGETRMKRTGFFHRKSPEPPIAWREAEYAALDAGASDAFDDRVSEDIFDVDDERAEIANIVHGMIHDAN